MVVGIALILVSLLEFMRRRVQRDRALHGLTALSLDRELAYFETRSGPYADATSPERLLSETVTKIIHDAESERLRSRVGVRL